MDKSFHVLRKEFFNNLFSIRLFILGSIFAIIVLGVSYGISIESFYQVERENIMWAHSVTLDDDGIQDDLVVYYTDFWGKPMENKRIYFYDLYHWIADLSYKDVDPSLVLTTDEEGRVFIKDLTDYMHTEDSNSPYSDHYYIIECYLKAEIQDDSIQTLGDERIYFWSNQNMTRQSQLREHFHLEERIKHLARDLEQKDSKNDVLFHTVTPTGSPSRNANLYFQNETVAEANKHGFMEYEFPEGEYEFNVTDEYGSRDFIQKFRGEEEIPLYKGPDHIIIDLAMVLSIVIPLVSIALAYDSVAKERENNSLFFLLIKPIKKWKLALGKFSGALFALSIPVLLVNIVSIMIIWRLSEKAPSLELISVFLLGSVILLAVYIALQMIISTVSTSSGTAILGGMGIWVFFTLFFRLMKMGLSYILNLKTGSYGFEVFSNYLDMANPNFIFMKIVLVFGPNNTVFTGINNWYYYILFSIWLVIPIACLLLIFERKLGER